MKCKHKHLKKSLSCKMCYYKNKNRKRGYHWSEDAKEKRLAEKNPNWHGDGVTYIQLHVCVASRLKRPSKCPKCKRKNYLDLANKGIYDRNLKNWEWLCRRCHMKKDGRLSIMKQKGQKKDWSLYKS